jgi:site-specific DNA-methyltransferase (adenine-specific)
MRKLKKGSIDLIFTDPPYVKEQWEKAYSSLVRHAKRILKPSGYLFTYCPQYRFDQIFKLFQKSGLKYYWICSQLNLAETGMVYQRNAICLHKPILIFQKEPMRAAPLPFTDVIRGNKQKQYHAWQQDVNDALGLLCRFAVPGDTVLDPFAGSGTTLLAAKLLGLEYIGFEIDPNTYRIACQRLEQQPLDLRQFCEVST